MSLSAGRSRGAQSPERGGESTRTNLAQRRAIGHEFNLLHAPGRPPPDQRGEEEHVRRCLAPRPAEGLAPNRVVHLMEQNRVQFLLAQAIGDALADENRWPESGAES